MENELMPCPVCGGYVDVGWDSDSQGQAVECSTDMNPWHYKVASGDVSKAVEAHNALARHAEIGRLVEQLTDACRVVPMVGKGEDLLTELRARVEELTDE